MSRYFIGMHWLEFTIHDRGVEATIEELNFYRDNELRLTESSMYGYITMHAGSGGLIILSDYRYTHHHVIVPGRWLSEVGEAALALLSWVLENNGKVTRIDLACDDSEESPNPEQLRSWCNEGQLVTRYRRRNSLENHGDGSVTNYFGSMRSDRYIRVYDKTKETKGNIKATRWEIVLRKEYAQQCANLILDTNLNVAFLGTLRSLVDFRKPTSEDRESRRPQLEWYRNMLQGVMKAEYTRYEPVNSIERMDHWLQKQVSRTLATVVEYKGGDLDYVIDLIYEGGKKKRRV